jgi:hypothetical protein
MLTASADARNYTSADHEVRILSSRLQRAADQCEQ